MQATDEQAQAMLANEIGAEKQVVYHGSRAKFKNFDHSHMGEGEGQQAYGWGSYVTEVEGIARTYAAENGKIKFRGFVLEAMHSLEVKEHFSGAERKVLNFLHKWIKRSNNASTAIEKVKEWASNEYEKYYCCPIKPLYTAISSLNPAEIGMISSYFKFQAPH